MAAICREAETVIAHTELYNDLRKVTKLPADTTLSTAIAAVEASLRCQARAIICITTSGKYDFDHPFVSMKFMIVK